MGGVGPPLSLCEDHVGVVEARSPGATRGDQHAKALRMFQIWTNAGMGVRQAPAANDIKALGGGVH